MNREKLFNYEITLEQYNIMCNFIENNDWNRFRIFIDDILDELQLKMFNCKNKENYNRTLKTYKALRNIENVVINECVTRAQ